MTRRLLLASTSPQRRALLEELGIPFDAVAPRYEEHDPPDADATRLVRDHALAKARSVLGLAAGRPVLGVDTTVVLDGRVYAKATDDADAGRMLEALSGRTHAVISGLALVTPEWEQVEDATTLVTFRNFTTGDVAAYLATGEWAGRAGAYAIQGEGATLVERIEGDHSNVVGLPTELLLTVLNERFPGRYRAG